MHESDYWPEDQRQYASWHLWPKDGFDWALIIGIPQGFNQIQYNPIALDKVDFIHTLSNKLVNFNGRKFEYLSNFPMKV